jgi:hypothetical protein
LEPVQTGGAYLARRIDAWRRFGSIDPTDQWLTSAKSSLRTARAIQIPDASRGLARDSHGWAMEFSG